MAPNLNQSYINIFVCPGKYSIRPVLPEVDFPLRNQRFKLSRFFGIFEIFSESFRKFVEIPQDQRGIHFSVISEGISDFPDQTEP